MTGDEKIKRIILSLSFLLLFAITGCLAQSAEKEAQVTVQGVISEGSENTTENQVPIDKSLPEDVMPLFQNEERICTVPILFMPADASLSDKEIEDANQLLKKHLEITRVRYKKILGTTFCINYNKTFAYHSRHTDSYFIPLEGNNENGSAYRITKEMMDFYGENRYNSSSIYLIIYVRPINSPYSPEGKLFGGGRTFNGAPNSGGGYIELEYSALIKDQPYTFQATLRHEIGHSFGLAHVSCLGGNLYKSGSFMSYDPSHESMGLAEGADPGSLTPEEIFVLSLNKRVFPSLKYDSSGLNAFNISRCFLGPMKESIGPYKYFPSVGYELYFNGKLVSSPESTLSSFRQAKENCQWNIEHHKNVKVECRYNGKLFLTSK